MKKLICLFLSLVMLLGVCLTGCAEKTDDEAVADKTEEASATATTLAVYLMSEAPVSAETAKAVEDAVNEITKAQFKTKLKLYYYTADEYYAKLDAAFEARKGTTAFQGEAANKEEDETFINEWGTVEIKYPELTAAQVDIFYLGGKANYDKYKNANLLTRLDNELVGDAALLTKYIPDEYFTAMKAAGNGTYALPTAKAIGDYTYLLLSKEVMEASKYATNNYSAYTSLTCTNCNEILKFVSDTKNGLTNTYYPLYTNLSIADQLVANLQYWGTDANGNLSDTFSVLGGYYSATAAYMGANAYAPVNNLLNTTDFTSALRTLVSYEEKGYYGTPEQQANKKFAVGYVSGGAELYEQYGKDYVMVPVVAPTLTEDELFSDMFAVSSYTSGVSRSVEILTYLNTDPELRNLILYGIEDQHYDMVEVDSVNENGEEVTYSVVRRRNDTTYMMDVNKTGNVSLAYATENDVTPLIRQYMIQQNLDAKIKLSLGLTLNYDGYAVNTQAWQNIKTLSEKVLADYTACTTVAEFETFLTNAKAEVAANADVKLMLDADHGLDDKNEEKTCDKKCGSFKCVYDEWLKDQKIVKK